MGLLLLLVGVVRGEAHGLGLRHPLLDDLVQPHEGPGADEEDVPGVDLDVLLLRVLPAPLRRDVGDGPFDELQERLLHALPGDVPGDGRVLGLPGDLVDLVHVDDPALGALDVEVAVLQEGEDDVLDVLPDVARFRERGGVGDGERTVEELRQGLGDEGLPRAGGAGEEDVRLRELDVLALAGGGLVGDPLVVVVDRDGDDLLRPVLADHVLVEVGLDLVGLRHVVGGGLGDRLHRVFEDDVVAELDTFVTNVDPRARDQLLHFLLGLSAEVTVQTSVGSSFLFAHIRLL